MVMGTGIGGVEERERGLRWCWLGRNPGTNLAQVVDGLWGGGVKGLAGGMTVVVRTPFMSWEFTEDAAFLALCDAYKESGEPSAMEFLAHGEGAFHFQELSQNAAGEGIDLSDSADLEEFQQEVIDALEEMCA
jgi:hypothetical protein